MSIFCADCDTKTIEIAQLRAEVEQQKERNAIMKANMSLLEEELRAELAEAKKVAWGVDWGTHGDQSCCCIIKKHHDGTMEVVAVEYSPASQPTQKVEPVGYVYSDLSGLGAIKTAAIKAYIPNGTPLYTAPQPATPDGWQVTDAMVDAFIGFANETAYLNHPDVPYYGTANGDSEDQWRRRMMKAALEKALAAALKKEGE